MAHSSPMGRSRVGGLRWVVATLALVAPGWAALVAPAAASAAGPAAPPHPPVPLTTTTLPPLPNISPQYSDGQPPQKLLANAISLASLGLDHTAILSAVAATQAELDADALTARRAEAAAAAAARKEAAARASADAARSEYQDMAGAIRQAVLDLYMSGPESLTVSPQAGSLAIYAEDYAYSAITPYGVLARSRSLQVQRADALRTLQKESRSAAAAQARAARALTAQKEQLARLESELASLSASSAAAVAADHLALAGQAGKELLSASALQFTPKSPLPSPVATTDVALTWAFAELGKPYVWGGTGPDTFDCSGLTQFVWKAAGVSIPRVAADQDAWAIPVPLSDLLPGDLVFFGTTDIHHVGIYIGDGLMINAPHTGTVVQVSSIWWSDLAGFGRVHYPGTPVPAHNMPSPSRPVTAVVTPSAGDVPSQTKPPKGWKPKPGVTTPIKLGTPGSSTESAPVAGVATTTTITTAAPPTTSTSVTTSLGAVTTTTVTGAAGGTPDTSTTTSAATDPPISAPGG